MRRHLYLDNECQQRLTVRSFVPNSDREACMVTKYSAVIEKHRQDKEIAYSRLHLQ